MKKAVIIFGSLAVVATVVAIIGKKKGWFKKGASQTGTQAGTQPTREVPRFSKVPLTR